VPYDPYGFPVPPAHVRWEKILAHLGHGLPMHYLSHRSKKTMLVLSAKRDKKDRTRTFIKLQYWNEPFWASERDVDAFSMWKADVLAWKAWNLARIMKENAKKNAKAPRKTIKWKFPDLPKEPRRSRKASKPTEIYWLLGWPLDGTYCSHTDRDGVQWTADRDEAKVFDTLESVKRFRFDRGLDELHSVAKAVIVRMTPKGARKREEKELVAPWKAKDEYVPIDEAASLVRLAELRIGIRQLNAAQRAEKQRRKSR
jgi:hypothetical protein